MTKGDWLAVVFCILLLAVVAYLESFGVPTILDPEIRGVSGPN